jgi:glycosyltransferase involved in cell wall biosynthesis
MTEKNTPIAAATSAHVLAQDSAPDPVHLAAPVSVAVSAIVPARNEEAVIAACVESLIAQPEIREVIVVNDQSSDKTALIVREVASRNPKVRLLETEGPPQGWVGKNYAVAVGAREAKCDWLLFTDADAEHLAGSTAQALAKARESGAALVSFSPEQITERWYERALIPFVYCRLAKLYSYDAVNDEKKPAAAANGQYLMIRRDAYEAVGGHASVAGEVLEDVALARSVKRGGFRLWFGSGRGVVRVRMYRSFAAMWEGWKKNLYRLIGGTPRAMLSELDAALPWMIVLVLLIGIKVPWALFLCVLLLLARQLSYGAELVRNRYPFSYITYYLPAVVLYVGVLCASYRAHAKGRVKWKGREYQMEVPETSGK